MNPNRIMAVGFTVDPKHGSPLLNDKVKKHPHWEPFRRWYFGLFDVWPEESNSLTVVCMTWDCWLTSAQNTRKMDAQAALTVRFENKPTVFVSEVVRDPSPTDLEPPAVPQRDVPDHQHGGEVGGEVAKPAEPLPPGTV